MSKPTYPFFVYGTLLAGQPNAYLWRGAAVEQVQATLANGRLYDFGAFPMMIEAGSEPVKGLLIEIAADRYETVLANFDMLEGVDPKRPSAGAYRRELRGVVTEDGRLVEAWVYLGSEQFVVGRPQIKDNDWAARMQTKTAEVNNWWSNVDTTPE